MNLERHSRNQKKKADHVHVHVNVNVHVYVYVNVHVDVDLNVVVNGSCHPKILSSTARICGLVVQMDTDVASDPFVLLAARVKILCRQEGILLGGFLGVLRVLAVNADLQINRQVAKDAK